VTVTFPSWYVAVSPLVTSGRRTGMIAPTNRSPTSTRIGLRPCGDMISGAGSLVSAALANRPMNSRLTPNTRS
jgi:hypothetical protein